MRVQGKEREAFLLNFLRIHSGHWFAMVGLGCMWGWGRGRSILSYMNEEVVLGMATF